MADYFLRKDEELIDKFFEDFEDACALLFEMPEIGYKFFEDLTNSNLNLLEVRRWQMKQFKQYYIFYKYESGKIIVIRILNGKRDILNLFSEWSVD